LSKQPLKSGTQSFFSKGKTAMAKIDVLTYKTGNGEAKGRFINVSAVVGKSGVNNKNDVLVVQAMIKIVAPEKLKVRHDECPEPTGTFDKRLVSLIKRYQAHNSKFVSPCDGHIYPAKGESYHGSKKLWTIIKLNQDVAEIFLLSDPMTVEGTNHIEQLISRYPQVSEAIAN